MKRLFILSLAIALPACSGDDSKANNDGGVEPDASLADVPSSDDVATQADAGPDAPSATDATADVDAGRMADASDGAISDSGPAETDASDGGCPAEWFVAPVVDPMITVPDGGGHVLLHALGTGTQNYVCSVTTAADGGIGYAYTLVTPSATLSDCHDAVIGHHFASEGGAGFPEWQTTDGTYVIGQKHAQFTPDGGSGSIPWLLIGKVDAGGSGTLSQVAYIQRLDTDGGVAPAGCDGSHLEAGVNVPYSADYYFFAP